MNVRLHSRISECLLTMSTATEVDVVVDQFGLGYGHLIFALNRGFIDPDEFGDLVRKLRKEFINGINRLEESDDVEKQYSAYG